MNTLSVLDQPTNLPALSDAVIETVRKSKAPATLRAVESDARAWVRFAEARGIQPSPPIRPADLAEWLVSEHRRGLKPSTISRRAASIAALHRAAGLPSPTSTELVRDTLSGIRREAGVRPDQKDALSRSDLGRIVGLIETDLRGLRDRALLLCGFAGGFRRSELIALEARDLTFSEDGVEVLIRRSKTDQEGEGFSRPIHKSEDSALCPVRALQWWLRASGIEEGPVFRGVHRHGTLLDRGLSGQAVALIVKSRASAAGLDPARIGAHSLRAGMATQAAKDGYSERQIANVGGWKSERTLRGYIRRGRVFEDSARVL